MKHLRIIVWLAIALMSIHREALGADIAKKPMNLLIITADDMNADSWGGNKLGATPVLDAFAASCYEFEQCHVSAPICQPSRSALMTGRVPHRNGALGFNPIRLDVPTLTEVMSSNGYFTAAINKTMHMTPKRKFKWDLSLEGSGKNPPAMRADLERCLQAAATNGKPFFINANITDPHRPFAGSRGVNDEEGGGPGKKATANEAQAMPVPIYRESEVTVPAFLEDIPGVRKEVAQYFSSVRRLDQTFAGLLAALKASGQEDNTLVVFLSDHGMSFPYSKATIFRNGTWSPVLFHWPGMGKPTVNHNDMVSSVDIMPTVLDLMSIARPAGMDGRSLVSLFKGVSQPGRDHVFTHVNTVNSGKSFAGRCVRTKTQAYIWNAWPDGKAKFKVEAMGGLSFKAMAVAAERDPKIKARVEHYLFRTPEEFYDEEKDPDERHNLIGRAECQADVARMRGLILAEMERTEDPLLEKYQKLLRQESVQCIEPDESAGSSRAVVVDDVPLAHTAQLLPFDREGRIAGNDDAQIQQVMRNVGDALKLADSDWEKVVKLNVYIAKVEMLGKVQQAIARKFTGSLKPAVSFVMGNLTQPEAMVAMDAIGAAGTTRNPQTVQRFGGPKTAAVAVLPAGGKFYISGQAKNDALPGATRKTLESLEATLNYLGTGSSNVVQLKAFVQPISDKAIVEAEVVKFFGNKLAPAVVYVEWSSPTNTPIEIELVAAGGPASNKGTDSVDFSTPPGMSPSKVYSKVAHVNHGKIVYFSGLYGEKASDGAGQIREIFGTLNQTLTKTGSDFDHLVKATYYVSDNEAGNKLNELRPEFYNPLRPPAASKAMVKAVGMPGKTIVVDMIAVTK